MGNYSYKTNQEGCEIDFNMIKAQLKNINDKVRENYFDKENMDKLKNKMPLSEIIDGWKIQGYWYPEFVSFLYVCARAMVGLTEDEQDNYIEMEEEQGFKFIIYFTRVYNEENIEILSVPMEWIRDKAEEEIHTEEQIDKIKQELAPFMVAKKV